MTNEEATLAQLAQQSQMNQPAYQGVPLSWLAVGQQNREPWRVRRLRVQLAGLVARRATTEWFIKMAEGSVPGSLVTDVIRLDGQIAELRERIKQKGYSA